MDIHEIVKKLVGKIYPVGYADLRNANLRNADLGETDADNDRFENLKAMTKLVDDLLTDINWVAQQNNRHEYSINRAGQFAASFLEEICRDYEMYNMSRK